MITVTIIVSHIVVGGRGGDLSSAAVETAPYVIRKNAVKFEHGAAAVATVELPYRYGIGSPAVVPVSAQIQVANAISGTARALNVECVGGAVAELEIPSRRLYLLIHPVIKTVAKLDGYVVVGFWWRQAASVYLHRVEARPYDLLIILGLWNNG